MWPEPVARILAASGGVVLLAVFGVVGVWVKNIAEASNARAKTATEHAKAATDIASAARAHIADVERRMELQRVTFQLQARELNSTNLQLRSLEWQREHTRMQWQDWARDVAAAQEQHYKWDKEVVEEIERMGGQIREAPAFEVRPPVEFD